MGKVWRRNYSGSDPHACRTQKAAGPFTIYVTVLCLSRGSVSLSQWRACWSRRPAVSITRKSAPHLLIHFISPGAIPMQVTIVGGCSVESPDRRKGSPNYRESRLPHKGGSSHTHCQIRLACRLVRDGVHPGSAVCGQQRVGLGRTPRTWLVGGQRRGLVHFPCPRNWIDKAPGGLDLIRARE